MDLSYFWTVSNILEDPGFLFSSLFSGQADKSDLSIKQQWVWSHRPLLFHTSVFDAQYQRKQRNTFVPLLLRTVRCFIDRKMQKFLWYIPIERLKDFLSFLYFVPFLYINNVNGMKKTNKQQYFTLFFFFAAVYKIHFYLYKELNITWGMIDSSFAFLKES